MAANVWPVVRARGREEPTLPFPDVARQPLKMFLDKGVRWIFYPLGSPALSTSEGSYLHRRNS